MLYLLIVSFIWAFSFGLIKTNLTSIDSNFVAFLRLFVSFIVFLPFVKIERISNKDKLQLALIGAVQYGLMYLAYIYAYQFLQAYEIVLFTIFTPIYLTVFNDLLKKKFNKKYLIVSVLAVIGAGVIKYSEISSSGLIWGFLLVQISNICFAIGQILYVNKKKSLDTVSNLSIFAMLYFGAALITLLTSLVTVDFSSININSSQILTIIYLGAIASGFAFYLWNVGATKVNEGTLAIFNNLKIPLGIIVSIFIFGENTDFIRLSLGGVIMISALYYNEKLKNS